MFLNRVLTDETVFTYPGATSVTAEHWLLVEE